MRGAADSRWTDAGRRPGAAVGVGLAALASLVACSAPPAIELQIADVEPPYLEAGVDFDRLVVETRRDGCLGTETSFGAAPLPATLTLVRGDCYVDRLSVRARALLGEGLVAESAWTSARFPDDGLEVVTATLADRGGRRVLFETGYEAGEARAPVVSMLVRTGARDADVSISTVEPLAGDRSVRLIGTATSGDALVLARVAAPNVELEASDALVFTWRVDGNVRLAGVELELSSGATAASLGLAESLGRAIAPSSAEGRPLGAPETWVVPLGPAVPSRLVGVRLGLDLRGAPPGSFDVRLDELRVVRP